MPKLVKLYIQQCFIGFGLSAVFVGALLATNVGNLWHLVTHTDAGLLAVVLLWVFNGIVFSGVQFGWTIMRMQEKPTPPGGGKRQRVDPMLAPAAIPAKTGKRRLL